MNKSYSNQWESEILLVAVSYRNIQLAKYNIMNVSECILAVIVLRYAVFSARMIVKCYSVWCRLVFCKFKPPIIIITLIG